MVVTDGVVVSVGVATTTTGVDVCGGNVVIAVVGTVDGVVDGTVVSATVVDEGVSSTGTVGIEPIRITKPC